MEDTLWMVIGTLGMWLIEASYLPQIMRLWRRKEANDLSVCFPAMNLCGRLAALAYSAHLGSSVLALGFLLGVMVRAAFLGQVIIYRRFPSGSPQDNRLAAPAQATNSTYQDLHPRAAFDASP